MPDGFTFEDDDKKSAAAPSKGGFSWEDDKSAPPKEASAAASSAPAKQPEGMWHSAATAIGINPEEVSAAMVHPWESLKSAGSEALSELRHPGTVLSQAAQSLPSLLNPEAQQTAVSRMKSPGWKNKILGGEEYLESGIPGVGSNLVKSHEQAAQGNNRGMIGTIAGTVLPSVIDPGVRANIGEMMPSKAVATLPMRAAVRGAERAVNDLPGLNVLRAGKGLMQPADEAVNMRIKIPGRDFGLPAPAEAMPAVESNAPAEAASQPYSAGMPAVREPGRTGPPLQRLEELIQQASGTPPGRIGTLEPATSLRSQPPQSLGAASEGFTPAVDPTRNVSLREQRQLQKPFGNRSAVEVSEMHGPRTVAPEKIPQVLSNAVDEAMGAEVTPQAREKMRLQAKYPDAGDRQEIHRTSEKVFEATRDNPKLRKGLGDLPAHDNKGGPDLARAAANLGEDLGERRIGNKKAEWMGAGQIGRGEMFDRLLDKGYTAQEIFDAAHAEPKAGKPGMMRATGERPAREKTGD